MCGIVGAVAQRNVLPILIEGLKRLEYRGYDSAGVAVMDADHHIQRVRAVGKVAQLEEKLQASPIQGQLGIAHTRWATHGVPSEQNAHPHAAWPDVAIVHNGIIENYQAHKAALAAKGIQFESETDSEVIAHLIAEALTHHAVLKDAVNDVTRQLEGAYGLVVACRQFPGELVAVRSGSPLVIGLGLEENFLASDSLSLLPVTNRFIYLEEGDLAVVTTTTVDIQDASGKSVERAVDENNLSADAAMKGPYRHYMLKEIHEQPEAITNTLANHIEMASGKISLATFGASAEAIFARVKRVRIVACGTSYHAGLVAKYWLERYAGIHCDVDIASELRYRAAVIQDDCLFVTISQSGETADTLAALREAKEQGYLATLTLCNVPSSSLVRESDLVFLTHAGTEMGVASTKAFTAQLTGLLLLTGALMQLRQHSVMSIAEFTSTMQQLPGLIQQILGLEADIEELSKAFQEKHNTLFVGRGECYPIALEGALKLKEISYIHAEGYPAGELKHGPLALVDKDMPVVAIAPESSTVGKLVSNLKEIQAREGEIFVFAAQVCAAEMPEGVHCVVLPDMPELLSPILYTIPLQIFSYYVAVLKGTDVDQPRNLAKSVTVE